VAPDLLKRNFTAEHPDQLWVAQALLNRVEVGDLHRRVVVAAR
jgi:hypothetical protein